MVVLTKSFFISQVLPVRTGSCSEPFSISIKKMLPACTCSRQCSHSSAVSLRSSFSHTEQRSSFTSGILRNHPQWLWHKPTLHSPSPIVVCLHMTAVAECNPILLDIEHRVNPASGVVNFCRIHATLPTFWVVCKENLPFG